MDHELGAVRYTINGVREYFGVTLTEHTFAGVRWATAHADLHWGNLRGPTLHILDWESWRSAPAGYDAATLHCNSLLHQPTARRVRAMSVLRYSVVSRQANSDPSVPGAIRWKANLDLAEVTVVAHDWGGPIGLRAAWGPATFYRVCSGQPVGVAGQRCGGTPALSFPDRSSPAVISFPG